MVCVEAASRRGSGGAMRGTSKKQEDPCCNMVVGRHTYKGFSILQHESKGFFRECSNDPAMKKTIRLLPGSKSFC
jgi:hypothetical protein